MTERPEGPRPQLPSSPSKRRAAVRGGRAPFLVRHGIAAAVLVAIVGVALVGIALLAGLPVWARVLLWGAASACGFVLIRIVAARRLAARGPLPLPALDRTPRVATVTANEESDFMTGWPGLYVSYRGSDDRRHEVHLADHVDDAWLDRFPVGSTCEVYAFRDPALADTVVFLTEAHDDVVRMGAYLWLGVRGEVRTAQFRRPSAGSPFLREGSSWRFDP